MIQFTGRFIRVQMLFTVVIGIFTTLMLTAFIYRMSVSAPVDSQLDASIKKNNAQEVIQLEVYNSTSVKGLAAKAMTFLRDRKFDVLEIGNSKDKMLRTLVIDRVGDSSSAKKICLALGLPDSVIVRRIDSNLFVRATVVLGDDYKTLTPFN